MFLHVSVILSTGGGGIPACIAGGILACLAGLWGWGYPSMPCRSPAQHPMGKLRGLAWGGLQAHTWGGVKGLAWGGVSRPTPKGEVEGSGQGVSRPTPGGVSRPTPKGLPGPHLGGYPSMHWSRHPPPDGYCCRWYASHWNAFLLLLDLLIHEASYSKNGLQPQIDL